MLQERLKPLLLVLVEQQNLINVQIKILIDEFNALNTEGDHGLLLYLYRLCAMINIYLKIILFY